MSLSESLKAPVGVVLGTVVAAMSGVPGLLLSNVLGGAVLGKAVNRAVHDAREHP